MARKKRGSAVIRLILVLVVLGTASYAGWLYLERRKQNGKEEASKDRFHVVKRGDFSVSVHVEGSLDAIKRHEIKCPHVRRKVTVAEVVENNTRVDKGDVIMRFSADEFEENLDRFIVQLDDEKKNLDLARKDREMAKISVISVIKNSADKLQAAKEAVKKYKEKEAVQKMKQLRRSIASAEEVMEQKRRKLHACETERANSRTNDTHKLQELRDKVLAAKREVEKSLEELSKAQNQLRDFKQYEHKNKLISLRDSVTKALMDLKQQVLNAQAKQDQLERKIKNHELKIHQAENQIEKTQESIKRLVIKAPVSGIVTLYPPRNGQEIKVGTQYYTNQRLASIPDLSRFLVRTDVPEEFRSKIKLELDAWLRCKAIPDLKMKGIIRSIAPMANHVVRWDKTSPKVYPTEIETDATDSRLMPGMTVGVEFITDEVKDVLFVPVECVYNREGATYVKIKRLTGVEEIKVKTGHSSSDYVEIKEGLEEGMRVLLFRDGTES